MKTKLKVLVVALFASITTSLSQAQKENSTSAQITKSSKYKNILFESQGTTLRGRLYKPQNDLEKSPVVIMAHGFTTTINGMTADKYAEEFWEAGYAVLLYDHQNLGTSEGEPRQEINFWMQCREYIDALDFAMTLPEIDYEKMTIWGCSLSAEEVYLVGSIDERVKAIVALVPSFGAEMPAEQQDETIYTFAKNTVLHNNIRTLSTLVSSQTPVVTADPKGSPAAITQLTAFNWFIAYGGKYGSNWKNLVSWSGVERQANYHVANFAPHLKAPILVIIATNDEMPNSDYRVAKAVYQRISKPKEWVDVDGGHFGLLHYPSDLFNQSSKAQIDFLSTHLN